jgi:hypothetical protein
MSKGLASSPAMLVRPCVKISTGGRGMKRDLVACGLVLLVVVLALVEWWLM